MNYLYLLIVLTSFSLQAISAPAADTTPILDSSKLVLKKSDHIIAEHIVKMINFIEKGYINQDVLSKVLKETDKSTHFKNFNPWLKEIKTISKTTGTKNFYTLCDTYLEKKDDRPLEKTLNRLAGNYCRERTLESIGRDIDKDKVLTEEAINFIKQHLKFYLTKKNKKNFSFFVKSQSSRPEILKKISEIVTEYSVKNEIIPSQEVLKDIVINEQITKLIQDKGFNPLQHKNVFYAEYGKLIHQGYRTLDGKPEIKKVKAHYKHLKNYLELNQNHLPVGLCLNRLNDFSKAVFRAEFKDLSRDIFTYIIKKKNDDVHEDALFSYLWTHLYYGEFKEARKFADKQGLIKNSSELSEARLQFWIAYVDEQLDKKKDAVDLYEEIVINHPLSYYAIMATKKLQKLKPDSPVVPFYVTSTAKTLSPSSLKIKNLSDDHISSLVRLKAWAKIDSLRMLNLELRRLKNHSMPQFLVKNSIEKQLYLKSDLHVLNASIIQGTDNHLAAFRYIYDVLNKKEIIFNRQLLDILYPQPYLKELAAEVKKEGIDPIILLSLIRQESVFNPLARSRVGARGLMQLMPNTAKRFKKNVRDRHLINPKINIRLGTKLFKNLIKRYDGNLVHVLSAYNAGESRVERWKKVYFNEDDTILINIEAIPFLETRNYVKLIFRNIFFYKLLIDQEKEIADSREPNKIFDIELGFKK